jgi:hypothetical protein
MTNFGITISLCGHLLVRRVACCGGNSSAAHRDRAGEPDVTIAATAFFVAVACSCVHGADSLEVHRLPAAIGYSFAVAVRVAYFAAAWLLAS